MTPADLGLIDRPLHSATAERLPLPPGVRTVAATLTGSGTVTELFLALGSSVGGLAPAVDTILQIGQPGQAPDISVDLGTLFASHFGQSGGLNVSGGHAHVELFTGGVGAGYVLTLPMPYSDGLEVALTNVTSETPLAYVQVIYSPGEAAPVRLRSSAITWANHITVAANAPVTLATIPGDGWLAWTSIVGVGTSGDVNGGRSWMERNVQIASADGTLTSSGLEDWFAGSYYFQNRRNYGTPWSFVGEENPQSRTAAMAVDLVAKWGGLRYHGGATVTLGTESGVSTAHMQSHCVLYYAETAAP